jgi:hypothetical protein
MECRQFLMRFGRVQKRITRALAAAPAEQFRLFGYMATERQNIVDYDLVGPIEMVPSSWRRE